jgi:hypothetical protein
MREQSQLAVIAVSFRTTAIALARTLSRNSPAFAKSARTVAGTTQ